MVCLLPLLYAFEEAIGAMRHLFSYEEQLNLTVRLDDNVIEMRSPGKDANSSAEASSIVQCCRTKLSSTKAWTRVIM